MRLHWGLRLVFWSRSTARNTRHIDKLDPWFWKTSQPYMYYWTYLGSGSLPPFLQFVTSLACTATVSSHKLKFTQPYLFGKLNNSKTERLETHWYPWLLLPLLASTRPNRCYTLDTDACDRQVGGVLLQELLKGRPSPKGTDWICSTRLNRHTAQGFRIVSLS